MIDATMTKLNLLDEFDAAETLGVSVHTLRRRRHLGKPPKYVKLSRSVKYRLEDLAEWVNQSVIEPARRVKK